MAILSTVVEFFQNNFILSLIVLAILLKFALSAFSGGPMEEFPGNKVTSIVSDEQWKEIISQAAKNKKLVVIDFYATWCGPCKYASPIYGKMSTGTGVVHSTKNLSLIVVAFKEIEDVVFLKVDVDKMRNISMVWRAISIYYLVSLGLFLQENNVRAMPTFVIYKNGAKVCLEFEMVCTM
jgi:thiol-disulfide isomerase/thioredoxin